MYAGELLRTTIGLFASGAVGFSGGNNLKARQPDKSDEDGHSKFREHDDSLERGVVRWGFECWYIGEFLYTSPIIEI